MSEGDAASRVGYDEWLDALADGDGFYLRNGGDEATVPPAPGRGGLEREPLPARGTVEAVSTIHVPHPEFGDDAPYAIAVASFGPVRLTGQVRGVDPEAADLERGLEVEPTVVSKGENEDHTESRFVGFIPVEANPSER
ncbi:hypothetical protein SAMN05444422_108199 [Halobiforma haloterrestris]|uniref:ChsH2 C-terminal OB-fold domain-containing protein n=1 Tax=Natronobacterium haloterrestre TaxID=148448 RepID=A0A1I1J9I9_NATHA|nr:OB-fold domain-containing protein [Halobiforma haloterrestris]SFC45035.1 hypothetical protein SAMN05444422_108199 [Halobiforma haloterrestris]